MTVTENAVLTALDAAPDHLLTLYQLRHALADGPRRGWRAFFDRRRWPRTPPYASAIALLEQLVDRGLVADNRPVWPVQHEAAWGSAYETQYWLTSAGQQLAPRLF